MASVCLRSPFSIGLILPRRPEGRRQRACLPRRLALTMVFGTLSCGLVGCGGKEEGVLLVSDSVSAPAILRSEAEQVVIPVRIDAPLRFENRGSQEQLLGVSATGCSCYGIATEQFVLHPQEKVALPAGGGKDLFFMVKLLEGDGDVSFRVGFQVQGDVGQGGAGETGEFRASCTMKILPDLDLEPGVLAIDLPRGDAPADTGKYPVVLKRVTRGKPASLTPPEFSIEPAVLKAEPCRMEGAAEEVEPGLWRSVWTTSVTLGSLPDDVRENGGKFTYVLEFPDDDEGRIVLPGRRPETGKLPTLLEVVRDAPERRVAGQFLLRRSRGVVAPAQVHFGALSLGAEPRTRRIVLTAADQEPFVVTVEGALPQVEAAPDSQEPASQQWVTVTFNPSVMGAYEEPLLLKTTHPDDPEVQVVVKARVN
ncbi:hypothetical protein Pan44_47830 [Caulifigura coniformis]|uniref:DUF1573 domain-containing protein n=1 Tax=Caulifigura coniformis TaxID=2527983 RepID=A0A517SKS0_9PLAN|nr:hypothetical protein [Caulifigura coniformis]QDT56723.1 hypothetical protein Pan44_47830 [Caulifigura coniformis]